MFRRIYLDHSATTPLDTQVLEEMMPYLTSKFGNPSSIHFFGQEARAAIDKARHQVAGILNSRPNEIVFTSGGTESNNLAIRGLVEANGKYGNKIITSAIEHSAVKNVCEDLKRRGFEIVYLPVYEDGIVRIEDIRNVVDENTLLISIMTANNEIGTLQPIEEIGKLVREEREKGNKIWFHTDAVQAVGKMETNVEEMGCDLLSMSGHKLYGPKGIGALYVRRGVRLHPQNIGGHQERERRGGTEAVPNIVGIGKACEISRESMLDQGSKIGILRDKLEQGVMEKIKGAAVNGHPNRRLPNISNISFEGIEGEAMLISLDMQGVAVSTGSACSSGSIEPSPVIKAIGRPDGLARGAIRFSLGKDNSVEDVDYLLEILPKAAASFSSK